MTGVEGQGLRPERLQAQEPCDQIVDSRPVQEAEDRTLLVAFPPSQQVLDLPGILE